MKPSKWNQKHIKEMSNSRWNVVNNANKALVHHQAVMQWKPKLQIDFQVLKDENKEMDTDDVCTPASSFDRVKAYDLHIITSSSHYLSFKEVLERPACIEDANKENALVVLRFPNIVIEKNVGHNVVDVFFRGPLTIAKEN